MAWQGLNSVPKDRRLHGKGLPLLGALLSVVLAATTETRALAAVGTVLQTFTFDSTDLVADPYQPYMYASVSATNSLAVINTQSLSVAKTITLPGAPQGMSLAADGKTLYIADSSNRSIDVIDTQTLTLTRSLSLATTPYDVAAGLGNRLYVLDDSSMYCHIEQIDALTGGSAGPTYGPGVYYGDLSTSPDRRTLYHGDHGLSQTTLFSFDVSSGTITTLGSVVTGANGENAVLSHGGATIAQPNGYPYSVTLYRSSDFAALGSFNTGAHPNALAFSPDDQLAYVSHSPYPTAVDIFSTATFARLGQFNIGGSSSVMETDPTGRELFVAQGNTVVYDTGVSVPEPCSLALLAVAVGMAILKGFSVALVVLRKHSRTSRP
jgi:YVTN family beta-propeller protein